MAQPHTAVPHRPRVVGLRGGMQARVQLAVLRAALLASRPIQQRGIHRVTWKLAGVFDDRNAAILETGFGRMRIPLADGYATKLLDSGYRYEPEIETLISRAMSAGCYMVDGGANLGYWSVLASHYGAERVVAVEPIPALYDIVEKNAELNGNRFACHRAALWSHDGEELTLMSHPQKHAGSTAVESAAGRLPEGSYTTTAPTLTVDRITSEHFSSDGRPILIKLDIEGAEPDALAGATETLSTREVLLLYEDHGDDPEHRSTRHVFDRLGYRVFACTDSGLQEIHRVGDVARYKTDTVHGFNFLAFPPTSAAGSGLLGT